MTSFFPSFRPLLVALAFSAGVAAGAAASKPFVLRLENEAAVTKVWGDVRSYSESRTLWGRDEPNPAHRRGASVGAFSNAIFDVGPFIYPAGLRVNLETLHGDAALVRQSYVMIEVVDAAGKTVEPFSRERCLLVDVNDLGRTIAWGGTNSAALVGKEVRLRFHVRDARIFSLHTVTPPLAVERAPTRFDLPPPDLPRELLLTLGASRLAGWEATRAELHVRTAGGAAVNLDRAAVEFLVEGDGGPLQFQSDKRDRQVGYVTLAGGIAAPRTVKVRARVQVGPHTLTSAPVDLRLELAAAERERAVVQLFLQPGDITDRQGEVLFAANTVMPYARTRGLPTSPKAMTVFGRRVGDRYEVWGSSREHGGLYRAETKDGLSYENVRPLETTMAPEHFLSMTYNERDSVYLALERGFGPSQFRALASKDGTRFEPVAPKAFADRDGAHVFWDNEHGRYVVVGLTVQRTTKARPFGDNMGGASGAGVRRVFSIRQSLDGKTWTPGQDVLQGTPSTWLPAKDIITPDDQDPPDLEFYWFLAFRHHDRWMGIAMTYAPSPSNVLERVPYDPYPSKHGPHLGTEWWVSADGLKWERPWRDTQATLDWRTFFGHAPLRLHDRLLFLASNQLYNVGHEAGAPRGTLQELYSLPLDRIASTGSRSPASFTSRPLSLPLDGLGLNYESEGHLAVELLDAAGRPVAGSRLKLPPGSAISAPLRWSPHIMESHAGREVRLRFHTENSRIYALYRH